MRCLIDCVDCLYAPVKLRFIFMNFQMLSIYLVSRGESRLVGLLLHTTKWFSGCMQYWQEGKRSILSQHRFRTSHRCTFSKKTNVLTLCHLHQQHLFINCRSNLLLNCPCSVFICAGWRLDLSFSSLCCVRIPATVFL